MLSRLVAPVTVECDHGLQVHTSVGGSPFSGISGYVTLATSSTLVACRVKGQEIGNQPEAPGRLGVKRIKREGRLFEVAYQYGTRCA